jgi:hypothetical protein
MLCLLQKDARDIRGLCSARNQTKHRRNDHGDGISLHHRHMVASPICKCFLRGTQVITFNGTCLIEDILPGDPVLTLAGFKPVQEVLRFAAPSDNRLKLFSGISYYWTKSGPI